MFQLILAAAGRQTFEAVPVVQLSVSIRLCSLTTEQQLRSDKLQLLTRPTLSRLILTYLDTWLKIIQFIQANLRHTHTHTHSCQLDEWADRVNVSAVCGHKIG